MSASAAPDLSSVAQEVAAAQSAAATTTTTGESETTAPVDVSAQQSEPQLGDDQQHQQQHQVNTVHPAETGDFSALEVDTGSDRDSAFDDDYQSFTTSIKSVATDYKFEHGRRYHAYGEEKYMLPNDNKEIQRLELQHQVWQLSLNGRLYLAPVSPQIRTALDIGCGTGSWAIEFAEEFPDCRVVGADLSPIQPTMVPPNVEFIVDDITSPWVYDHKFDYIHSRAITVGIKNWVALVDEIWKHLEPGGWIEFQEYHAPLLCDDTTMDEFGPHFARWNAEMANAAAKAGTRLDAILSVPPMLEERGFINIGTASTKWPLGRWAKGRRMKKVGELFGQDIENNVEGIAMRLFTKVLGWSTEEVAELTRRAAEDIRSGRMHAYMAIDFLYAQKPPA